MSMTEIQRKSSCSQIQEKEQTQGEVRKIDIDDPEIDRSDCSGSEELA